MGSIKRAMLKAKKKEQEKIEQYTSKPATSYEIAHDRGYQKGYNTGYNNAALAYRSMEHQMVSIALYACMAKELGFRKKRLRRFHEQVVATLTYIQKEREHYDRMKKYLLEVGGIDISDFTGVDEAAIARCMPEPVQVSQKEVIDMKETLQKIQDNAFSFMNRVPVAIPRK